MTLKSPILTQEATARTIGQHTLVLDFATVEAMISFKRRLFDMCESDPSFLYDYELQGDATSKPPSLKITLSSLTGVIMMSQILFFGMGWENVDKAN